MFVGICSVSDSISGLMKFEITDRDFDFRITVAILDLYEFACLYLITMMFNSMFMARQ